MSLQHRTSGSSRRAGFTLVEVIVTLAIFAILAGVTVPTIIPMWQQQRTTERQSDAEIIYTTAQDNMAKLKAKGLLSDDSESSGSRGTVQASLGGNETLASALPSTARIATKGLAQTADSNTVVLSSDDENARAALDLLVPDVEDQLSDVGFGGIGHAANPHYCIEVNLSTGYVFGAYYSEEGPLYASSGAGSQGIDNSLYGEVANLRNDSDAGTLASKHVGYYGGSGDGSNGLPANFDSTDKMEVSWVGYFEFAKNGDAAQATGGYFYQINADNTVSDEVTDKLHNNSEIDEDAVDSSDGTAYGVLVSKSKVDSGSFVVPSDVYPEPYKVTVSDKFGVEGVDPSAECYFYKLESPNPPKAHTASYKIQYVYQQSWGSQEGPSSTHEGVIGSTARVTSHDIRTDGYNAGGIWNDIQNNSWRIDLDKSKLSGKVDKDGSLVLQVCLVQDGSSTVTEIPDSPTSTVLVNGVGTWHPWASAGNAKLASKAFYVDQNFAAAINTGTASAAGSTYQVRTDDQLQHIGMPYGSKQDAPIASYLSGTFFQTHNITIDQTWYPIGQESATNVSNARFSGKFYGDYAGHEDDDNTKLSPIGNKEGAFQISLGNGFKFSGERAYNMSGSGQFYSCGTFGYVTGTVANAHVVVDTSIKQDLSGLHFGTIIGDLCGQGAVSFSEVSFADSPSASLSIQQVSPTGGQTVKLTAIGGLCGNMEGDAVISHSKVLLSGQASDTADNPRLAFSSQANWATSATNAGGFVGRADCDKKSFIDDCELTLDGPARINGQGASGGEANMGGFIASSVGDGSIANCSMTIGGSAYLGSPSTSEDWGPTISVGGFVGALGDTVTNGQSETNTPAIEGSKLGIAKGGSLTVNTQYNNGKVYSGGYAGSVLEEAELQKCGLEDEGELNVTSTAPSSVATVNGGFVGSARGKSSCGTCSLTSTDDASITVSATGASQGSIGGVFGEVDDAADIKSISMSTSGAMAINGNPSSDAGNTKFYAGGLAGQVDGESDRPQIQDAHIAAGGSFSVEATAPMGSYAGGLVGYAKKADFQRVSIEKLVPAKSKANSAPLDISAENTTNWNQGTYAAGGFAYAENVRIQNSYVISRNATLNLQNRYNQNDAYAYTGGFAAYIKGNGAGEGIRFSYVMADIRADVKGGVSAFVDHFEKSLLRSDFAIGTLASPDGKTLDSSKAYAFARESSFENKVNERPAGDYVAVTDLQGATPYKFLSWKPEEREDTSKQSDDGSKTYIATPGCCIYDATATDPTEKTDPKGSSGDRSFGAHKVSYNWLTNAYTGYDKSYNSKAFPSEEDPYHYKSFVSYIKTKNESSTRYPFVEGSSDGIMTDEKDIYEGLSGTNPFPTATTNKDGKHVNYGKWIPEPRGGSN